MKILLLHQHFNIPQKGGALRSYFLAKALVDAGIETVLITSHNQPHYLYQNIEGIEVHFLPISYNNTFGFSKRIRSYLKFSLKAAQLGSCIPNIDRCYAISTPLTVGLAAIFIKWKRKIPFVFEVGDLWPDAPIQLGFVKNRYLKFILYRLEKFIYRQSESIVALSEPMREIIKKKMPGKKINLIPNMADLLFFKPEEKRKEWREKYGIKDEFVISYIGSLGYANGLECYLDCARIVQQTKLPVTFLLCGDGAMVPYLKENVKKLSIDNLKFIPFQNREGVKELMNITDAIFISYRQNAILQTGSPNKYFDGLAAGKLIIVNFEGWIKEEIEKAKCGFYVNPNQPTNIVANISRYLKPESELFTAKQSARELAKKYDRKKLSDEFVAVVKR